MLVCVSLYVCLFLCVCGLVNEQHYLHVYVCVALAGTVIGLVIYTGKETRSVLNTSSAKNKVSTAFVIHILRGQKLWSGIELMLETTRVPRYLSFIILLHVDVDFY